MNEGRCDERPKDRVEESTYLTYTGFHDKTKKRELKRRLIYEYRCDERLKTKNEEFTRLTDTG
jgi:hypothetical protein